jgi:hypothetical protein
MVDLDPDLERLSFLIRLRNMVDLEMATVLGRPASPGNLGEFIASRVFEIDLAPSGVNPGHDGVFRAGPMAGSTVNVKLYSEDAGLLDISSHPADYYLVLTGPKPVAKSGVRSLPRRIDAVYLFDIASLRADLQARGVGIGVATSVRKMHWQNARVYPPHDEAPMELTDRQTALLRLFAVNPSSEIAPAV